MHDTSDTNRLVNRYQRDQLAADREIHRHTTHGCETKRTVRNVHINAVGDVSRHLDVGLERHILLIKPAIDEALCLGLACERVAPEALVVERILFVHRCGTRQGRKGGRAHARTGRAPLVGKRHC